jgi:probable phosphoglycerate mutase
MNGTLFDGMDGAGGKDAGAGGWFVAHCDGGSRGNPGPAGYGAVVEDPQGRVAARLSEFLGKQTNNYAEYAGLLAVLKWALEHRVGWLRVFSDSELMVNQMKGRYKVGSPGLRPLWEEAKQRAARLEKFEMKHTLRGGNKDADKLANEAMDRGTGKSSKSASQQGSETGRPAEPAKPGRQVFEGLVKGGVVHLIEGELPDGVLVKVVWE